MHTEPLLENETIRATYIDLPTGSQPTDILFPSGKGLSLPHELTVHADSDSKLILIVLASRESILTVSCNLGQPRIGTLDFPALDPHAILGALDSDFLVIAPVARTFPDVIVGCHDSIP